MQPPQTPRIRIEDLPPIEQLTEEEAAAIFGAGPPKVRLGIEQLETRELMASSLMASLTGGVLRVEGTPNADRIRIVQNVDQVSIEGIAIQSGGANVASVSAGAISRIEIAPLGGTDSIFAELGTLKAPLALTDGAAGDYFSDSVSRVGQSVGSDVVKLLRSSDGTVFTLHSDNTVRINGNVAWTGIKDFALDAKQVFYRLRIDGVVERQPPGGSWNTEFTNVQKMGVNEYGWLTLLYNDGRLHIPGVDSWGGYKDLQFSAQSKVYALGSTGQVRTLATFDSWREVASGAAKMVLRSDGALFTLNTSDGWVSHNGVRLTSNVKEMVLAADQSLYTLHNNGELQKFHPNAGTSGYPLSGQQVGTNVLKFGFTEDGRLTLLYTKERLQSMSRDELKQALEGMSPDFLKSALQSVDQPTLKVALESMEATRLKLALDIIDRATLKIGLECIDGATLKVGLAGMGGPRLKEALEVINAATLKVALQGMTATRLVEALGLIDDATLKAGLQVIDAATLKVALEGLGSPRFKVAIRVIDEPTLFAGLNAVNEATRAAMLSEATSRGVTTRYTLQTDGRLFLEVRGTTNQTRFEIRYQQAGNKLFFLANDGTGHLDLKSLDRTTGALEVFSTEKLRSFAVRGGYVYQYTEGRLLYADRWDKGEARSRNFAHQEAGRKLFFLDDFNGSGHLDLMALSSDTGGSGALEVFSTEKLRSFAVRGGYVYQYTEGRLLYADRWDKGEARSGNISCKEVGTDLFFIQSGGDGHTYLYRFDARTGMSDVVQKFVPDTVKSFGVDSSWLVMQREDGTLFQQQWNNPASRTGNISCKVVGSDLFYLDKGTDGHYYLKRFDARLGMSDTARLFVNDMVKSFGVDSSWLVMQREDGTLFQQQWNNPTSRTSNIDYKEANGTLYYLDGDGHGNSLVKRFDSATGAISNNVNGFTLSGEIACKWLETGGATGPLGLPTSNTGNFQGGDITSTTSGELTVEKTVNVPGVGNVKLFGHLDEDGHYIFTTSINMNVAGFAVDGAEVTFAEDQLRVFFTLDVPNLGPCKFSAEYAPNGAWTISGEYPGPVVAGPVTLTELKLSVAHGADGKDHLMVDGKAAITAIPSNVLNAELHGEVSSDGFFTAAVTVNALQLGDFRVGVATATLTNKDDHVMKLIVMGSVDVGGLHLADLSGIIDAKGNYDLISRSGLNLGGYQLTNTEIHLSKSSGLWVTSSLGVGGVNLTNLSGHITAQGDYDLSVSQGFEWSGHTFASVEFHLSKSSGLTLSGSNDWFTVSGSIDAAGNPSVKVEDKPGVSDYLADHDPHLERLL